MIIDWKNNLPEHLHEEFDLFFREFNKIKIEKGQEQSTINIFCINQIIALRYELKLLKEERELSQWKMNGSTKMDT